MVAFYAGLTGVDGIHIRHNICFKTNMWQRSQSRMRGDYLFYEEKIETTQEERDAKAARRLEDILFSIYRMLNSEQRARRASDPNAIVPPPVRRKDRPSKPNGLTKQTYSVTVNLPGVPEPRKWHIVAYFSVRGHLLQMTLS